MGACCWVSRLLLSDHLLVFVEPVSEKFLDQSLPCWYVPLLDRVLGPGNGLGRRARGSLADRGRVATRHAGQ